MLNSSLFRRIKIDYFQKTGNMVTGHIDYIMNFITIVI